MVLKKNLFLYVPWNLFVPDPSNCYGSERIQIVNPAQYFRKFNSINITIFSAVSILKLQF